ncbi:MAG: HAD family hydrolase [Ruminococcaceae bacterium]|nr:HAD family hydrolase [Oscillospiraceae bacterium]
MSQKAKNRSGQMKKKKENVREINEPEIIIETDENSPLYGLKEQEVKERVLRGEINQFAGVKTKSEREIIFGNVFTFFNIVNFILAFLVILTGSFKNVLFLGVIFSNIIIGSFQEIRSKRIIDKLSLISAPKVYVVRGGKKKSITVNQIVLGDLVMLKNGNQICADSVVTQGEIEVNESLITGESDPVVKKEGDSLLSGSFVVSGSCFSKVVHIGKDNYASKIAEDAKYVKKPNSEIMDSLNAIVKTIACALIPVGVLLFCKQYFITGDTWQESIISTVAALIGMIPEGLVLLTSIVFAVSVIRLSQKNTLVQEMYSIETLARVDVLCLDKTGTITEGKMVLEKLLPLENHTESEMKEILAALSKNLHDTSPTSAAVRDFAGDESNLKAANLVPFSSSRKYSGAYFQNVGSYVFGAGEFILGEGYKDYNNLTKEHTSVGKRVLTLVKYKEDFNGKNLPVSPEVIGFIVISDKIREEAPDTLRYFKEQGVDIKIISGDNAAAVSSIAKRACLENAGNYVDATTLVTDEDIKAAAIKYSVFGRVTPQQKLSLVKALKEKGHTVAMTGDGVNDVLALKEADCSIAMASGSDAARTVSNLVLLDSNFASMPKVVAEGRRSINNLQRSAALFLTKTGYAIFIALFFIFVAATYPFEPIQLSLISSLTIGIPSFLLALEPNRERIKGKFIMNVINKALPSALTTIFNIIILVILEGIINLHSEQISTLAVMVTTFTSFLLIIKICYPFTFLRTLMIGVLAGAFLVAVFFMRDFLSLVALNLNMLIILAVLMVFSAFCFAFLSHVMDNLLVIDESGIKQRRRLNKKNRPADAEKRD